MKRANEDIRGAIIETYLKYCQVTNSYGLSDENFARLLRFELSMAKKDCIFKIIEELKEKNK